MAKCLEVVDWKALRALVCESFGVNRLGLLAAVGSAITPFSISGATGLQCSINHHAACVAVTNVVSACKLSPDFRPVLFVVLT